MIDKGMDFPQYRKLSNNKVFYCIVNAREFHEIQLIGSNAQLHKIEAKQYPEMVKIMDLIELVNEGILISDQKEYELLLRRFSL